MRRLTEFALAAVIAVVTTLAIGQQQAQAHPATVHITGDLTWPETYRAAKALRDTYGLPVEVAACAPGPGCVVVRHYSAPDGLDGLTIGTIGAAEIRLNEHYAADPAERLEVSYHELGHAMGLDHSAPCAGSMEPVLAACGYWLIGYTADEQQQLREMWG